MIKTGITIAEIKTQIQAVMGKPVVVKCSLGRNKYAEYLATINGVYNALFTVEPDDRNYLGKTAFSYAEVLCGRVKIKEPKEA